MQRRSGGRALGAVLFTDIVGSTVIAAEMGNTRWGELVARHHRIVRRLLATHGGHEHDTAGDGFFATFERPADAIRCAVETTDAVRELGIEVRAGVSFGELESFQGKPGGLVVNTAARVLAVAGPGEVLVPASVRELVPGSGIAVADHGIHQLKGLDGDFRLLKVVDVDGREVPGPLGPDEAAARRREIFPTKGLRRAPLLAGLGAGVLALTVAGVVLLAAGDEPDDSDAGAGPLRFAVVQVDPESGAVGASVPIGEPRQDYFELLQFIDHPIAAGGGGVWALRQPNLLHIDPVHADVRTAEIHVGSGWGSVETGFESVWLQNGAELYRINPATDELETFLRLSTSSGLINHFFEVGDEALWVGAADGTLVRIDPATKERTGSRTTSFDAMAVTRDHVWLGHVLEGEFVGVDPDTMEPLGDTIPVSGTVDQVVAHDEVLWVLDKSVGVVTRLDVGAERSTGSRRVGDDATDMFVGLGAVWVGDRDGSLYRIDTGTLEVSRFELPAEILGIAVDERI